MEGSLLKKMYTGKLGGRRRIGRPRKRWVEGIGKDMRELGVRGWRRKTQDRRVWASFVKQAFTLQES